MPVSIKDLSGHATQFNSCRLNVKPRHVCVCDCALFRRQFFAFVLSVKKSETAMEKGLRRDEECVIRFNNSMLSLVTRCSNKFMDTV